MMTTKNSPFDDWIRLTDSPFEERCAHPPLLLNNDTILKSPDYQKDLHIFDTKTESWNKYPLKEYTYKSHGVCLSNDKQTFYSYHGYSNTLCIVDLKKRKTIKRMPVPMQNVLDLGYSPKIMPDPYRSDIIHIIEGDNNDKHFMLNIDDETINTVYSFDKVTKRSDNFGSNGIIHIKHKNIWMYVSGDMAIHIYDYINNKWTNTEMEMPQMYKYFSYVLTNDEKYILIFAGCKYDKNVRKWIHSNDIIILDIVKMEYVKSSIKCPVITGGYNFSKSSNAIITTQGWIHLFVLENMSLSLQWKIHIDKMIEPSDVLISGYLKKYKVGIPNEIKKEIVTFHGDIIIIQQYGKKEEEEEEFMYQEQFEQIKRIWSVGDDKDDLIKQALMKHDSNVTKVYYSIVRE